MLLCKCHTDNTCLGNCPGLLSTLPTLLLWLWPYSLLDFGFLTWLSEKAMATHSSTLAWEIPWMAEPGRLQTMRSRRVGHDWVTSFSLSCTGEGNGKWLQYSCLENPSDRGAWWGAIYGVSQSWTWLMQLSSSSNSSSSSLALFSWAPKSLPMVTEAMKSKDACSLEEKFWQT